MGASAAAAPGDALYGAKRLIEETRLNLAGDPERAAALREQFRRERLSEIERLLAEGRAAEVSLTGPIEAIDGARWTVAGLPVVVGADTAIDGAPVVGALAQVDGRTGQGGVLAERVIVLVGGPPPEPTPTPRADAGGVEMEDGGDDPAVAPGLPPAATVTAAPTATASPTTSPTGTALPTVTALPTATVLPTALPTAEPSATPPPTATPDDDNDNGGDDNTNDNGGDDNGNDNDNSGSGGGDNDSDNDSDNDNNSGSGGDNDNDD